MSVIRRGVDLLPTPIQYTAEDLLNLYKTHLETKIKVQACDGIDVPLERIHPALRTRPFEHQGAITQWALRGGKRLIAASFGLGKTSCACETMRQIHLETGRPTLIIGELNVKYQFQQVDGPRLGMDIVYVRNDEEVDACTSPYMYTNYERVRDGAISAETLKRFVAVSLDEASVLADYGSKTFQSFCVLFEDTLYKFAATATPARNKYKELLHYAHWLGVADGGLTLTKYFKRNSTKAHELTLKESMEHEFWLWVSSWALFIERPSDLGFPDDGYTMPPLDLQWVCIPSDHEAAQKEKDAWGQHYLIANAANGVTAASREKRRSMEARLAKVKEIVDTYPDEHFILWHNLEDERRAIAKMFPGSVDVYGSQDIEEKEERLMAFSRGEFRILSTKPSIAGRGCNFQHYCHNMIFCGIGYSFEEIIQALHRLYRFMQKHAVRCWFIFTEAEQDIVNVVLKKWRQHDDLVKNTTSIIRQYGLANEAMKAELRRTMINRRQEVKGNRFTAIHNDSCLELAGWADNSVDLYCSSIPFGTQYEYVPKEGSLNDLGYNEDNAAFWTQMDYMIPHLYRTLKPGRICAIHIKDRIVFGNVTGNGFPELEPFSDDCVYAFRKHGFKLMTRVTVANDVVRENNQTYRLTYSEMCKDGTKMGAGVSEYWLIFRKPQSDRTKAYADAPVTHEKANGTNNGYPLYHWQIDADGLQCSDGNRLLMPEELDGYVGLLSPDQLADMEINQVYRWWREYRRKHRYNRNIHKELGRELERLGRLPKTFSLFSPAVPDHLSDTILSVHDYSRMHSLNGQQTQRRLENHICLARDSSVLTDRGYVAIQDVEIGDMVLTHMGRWRPVIAKQNTGIRPVVKLSAQGVPNLVLTPDHKVWARKGDWVRERDGAERTDPDWIKAQDVLGGYVNLKLPPEEKSELTKKELWLLGRWLADGHVGARGDFYVSIGREKLADFEQMAGECAGGRCERTATQIRLKKLSSALRDALFACGSGAANKQLPAFTLSFSSDDARSLLEGYLSGDGHYMSDRKRWMASSVSKELLLGLAMLVQRVHGTIASVYPGRPPGTKVIEGREVHTKQDWILCFDLPCERRTKPFILEDGAWKKVKAVESMGEAETWNLRVAEDESYTAEGCIVKNCPLPLDLIEWVIERFSNPGEVVCDMFGGIGSTAYQAIKMGRKGMMIELNELYWETAVKYLQEIEVQRSAPTLFELMELEGVSA